eukprot:210662-Chlamydomonas_euryale.AAC.1
MACTPSAYQATQKETPAAAGTRKRRSPADDARRPFCLRAQIMLAGMWRKRRGSHAVKEEREWRSSHRW